MRREHLLLGILLATASPALTQRPSTVAQEVVPKELALALIRSAQEGGDILVGSVPTELAEDLPVPPGGGILGSFVSPSYVQVVMTYPGRTDSALAFARRSLVNHGWLAWQPPVEERGGLTFRRSSSMMPTTFCRGTGQPDGLTVAASFYGPNTSLLRVTRSMNGMCDASMRAEATRSRIGMMQSPFATVPPLYPPAEAENSFAACRVPSSGALRFSSSQGGMPVRATMSATELLAHYGRQLDSAGWNAARGTESVRAVGKWTKADSLGTREVTLSVSGMPNRAGCYTVELSLNYD
jgi:hypothetical protein